MGPKRIILFVTFGLAIAGGCGNKSGGVECRDSTSCDRFTGGKCLVNDATSKQWCAYPDQQCPSGYRWSDVDVGEGLGGMCVADGADAGVDASVIDATIADAGIDAGPADGATDAGPTNIVQAFGAVGADYAGPMAVGPDGSIYITGVFSGDMTIAPINLTVPGGLASGLYVARLDGNDGHAIWAEAFKGVSIGGIGVDSSGNALIAATFTLNITVGSDNLSSKGGDDIYVAKLAAANGAVTWAKSYGSTGNEIAHGAAVDSSGDIYVAGAFSATGNLGGSDHAAAGGQDSFVAKYSGTAGAALWDKAFGSTMSDYAQAIAVDASGVVVAGNFQGTINAGGSDLVSAGADDVYLLRFQSSNGAHVFSERFGGTSTDDFFGVSIAGGSAYAIAESYGNASFGGNVLVGLGVADVVIAKYDATTGVHVWSKRFGGPNVEAAAGIAASATGIYATGYFASTSSFCGNNDLSSAGGNDVWVMSVDPSTGNCATAYRMGGTNNDSATAIALTTPGPVIAGNYQGVCYFAGIQKTSTGMTDVFVVRP